MPQIVPFGDLHKADSLAGKLYQRLATLIEHEERFKTLVAIMCTWVEILHCLTKGEQVEYPTSYAASVVVYQRHPDRVRKIQDLLKKLSLFGINTTTIIETVTPETLLDHWHGNRFGILDISTLEDKDFQILLKKIARQSGHMFNGRVPQIFIAHVTQPGVESLKEYIQELRL